MPPAAQPPQPDGPDAHPDARAVTTRFAKGDRDAFAIFYERTFDDALADARRLTGRDEHFCLDAVQDAYLRAARSLPAMNSWPACRAWLKAAIAGSAIDRIRADAARTRRESAVRNANPATHEHHDKLQALLARFEHELDERQWHALRLHVGGGLPLSAVGRAMSLSRHAVHGLVRRGLATLSAAPTLPKGDTHD